MTDMLTTETLKANETLAGLTDEQLAAIETLSRNDEDAVIGKRIGEIYRQMDDTIAKTTGVQRNGDEKTYNYLERAAKDIAGRSETYTQQIAALEKEKQRLEKALAEGEGSAEYERKIRELRAELNNAKTQYSKLAGKYDEAEKSHAKALAEVRINGEMERAAESLKLNEALPPAVAKMVRRQAVESVKKVYAPGFDEEDALVFHNADGTVMKNRNNLLMPVTAAELLTQELKNMGVLAEGSKRTGSGTTPPKASVSAYSTQEEAMEAFSKEAMAKGLVKGTEAYQAEIDRLWKENGVKSLPIR